VDLSKTYLAWAERNLGHNDFSVGPQHQLVHEDCLGFLAAGPAPGELYDIVVCDPPTFSNSKRMRADSFSIDRDWPQLLQWLRNWMAPGACVYFSTNSRGLKFDDTLVPADLYAKEITRQTVPEDFRNEKVHRCWLVEFRREAVRG